MFAVEAIGSCCGPPWLAGVTGTTGATGTTVMTGVAGATGCLGSEWTTAVECGWKAWMTCAAGTIGGWATCRTGASASLTGADSFAGAAAFAGAEGSRVSPCWISISWSPATTGAAKLLHASFA